VSRKAKKRWSVYSQREGAGRFTVYAPGQGEQVKRLPKDALVSADGNWAELHDEKGLVRAFVNYAV
jgi:hypothetical protein